VINLEDIKILEDSLSTYFNSTDIPISVIDEYGNVILSIGNSTSFCKFFSECTQDTCPCSQTHLLASKQAEIIGEAYIFSCPSGLINFTVPLLEKGVFKGSVLAGPFLMDFPDELMVNDIIQKFDISLNFRGKINSYLKALLIIEPYKVRHLSKLLFIVVTSVMKDERYALNERSLKHAQQVHIGESIQEYKNDSELTFYPYETEKELLLKVRKGDIIGAKSILNDLIGHIFFSSGGNMNVIKSRTLELCTLLSRASVEGGADLNEIFGLNRDFLKELNNIENLEDLSYWLVMVLERFTENVFNSGDLKNISVIEKSISYINKNYKTNISLDIIASSVHLNSSYFSTLFKKEMGISFSNYLNKIRIDKSKLLLKSTNYSILEIALEVGFEDQSYFTKVFKALTNMTPKEYKQKQY
jgi:two-component system response regulator YesN